MLLDIVRLMQVGVIFAHLSLRQAVEAFGRLVDMYDAGYTLPEQAKRGIAEELAAQVCGP